VRATTSLETDRRGRRELRARGSSHLIILDVRLPDGSGFDFCREMRRLGLRQPILMLTVQADETDKVLGLELGADDYVTKPTACASCCRACGRCCGGRSSAGSMSPFTGE